MRLLLAFLLVLVALPARAEQLLSRHFEQQLVSTLRRIDRERGSGQVAPAVGQLFLRISDSLQHSDGSEHLARQDLTPSVPLAKTKADPLEQALVFALRLHNEQRRKGTNVPYLSHLLGVAGRVIAETHDRQLAVAALLHDAVEDQGGEATLARIGRRFGRRTARQVAECSDLIDVPWHVAKQQMLEKISRRKISRGALVIKLADSEHNSTTMVAESALYGPRFWKIFHTGKPGALWVYREKLRAFERAGLGSSAMFGRLRRNVRKLHSR